MRRRVGSAVLVLAGLAGCSQSSSDTVKALPDALVHQSYVSDITIKSLPPNVSPEFRDTLLAALHKQLADCAHGKQPLRLDVTVSLFSAQNAAKTFLVGDSDVIKGSAELTDPASNTVVGDYDIAHSIGSGGLLGAALMAYPEEKMSIEFAREICHRAFGATD